MGNKRSVSLPRGNLQKALDDNRRLTSDIELTVGVVSSVSSNETIALLVQGNPGPQIASAPENIQLSEGDTIIAARPALRNRWSVISKYVDAGAGQSRRPLRLKNDQVETRSLVTSIINIPYERLTVIASGSATVTGTNTIIDTESEAVSDDLEWIADMKIGQIVYLRAAHTDRTTVIKHGAGNILSSSGSDIQLDNTEKVAMLYRRQDGNIIAAALAGGGVSGPTSWADNAVIRADGTDGKTIQGSGATISDDDNLTVPGDIRIDRDGDGEAALLEITGDAGVSRDIRFQTGSLNRWILRGANGVSETGSDAGSDFSLLARDDTGVTIDVPISITRAAGGEIILARPVTMNGGGLTVNAGNIRVDRTGDATQANLLIQGDAGQNRVLQYETGSSARWQLNVNSVAETGSDAGSNLNINAYSDAGSFIDTPIAIARAAGGQITLQRPVTMSGGALIINAGNIFLDRTGDAAQAAVDVRGDAGQNRGFFLSTGSSPRWRILADSVAEAGSDAGSNLNIYAFDDSGVFIDAPLQISRVAAGPVTLNRRLVIRGTDEPIDAIKDGSSMFADFIVFSNTTSHAPIFRVQHMGGTEGSPSTTLANFILGGFGGVGRDSGGTAQENARIEMDAVSNWTASSHETNIRLLVTANGSTTITEGLRLDGTGVTIVNKLAHQGTTLGFYNNTPVTRQTYGAPTGTATRTTFATATVTTAQLAQRVKAMIDDLRSVGIFA